MLFVEFFKKIWEAVHVFASHHNNYLPMLVVLQVAAKMTASAARQRSLRRSRRVTLVREKRKCEVTAYIARISNKYNVQ